MECQFFMTLVNKLDFKGNFSFWQVAGAMISHPQSLFVLPCPGDAALEKLKKFQYWKGAMESDKLW